MNNNQWWWLMGKDSATSRELILINLGDTLHPVGPQRLCQQVNVTLLSPSVTQVTRVCDLL